MRGPGEQDRPAIIAEWAFTKAPPRRKTKVRPYYWIRKPIGGTTGRHCGRRPISCLGVQIGPLPAPFFLSIFGSITHFNGSSLAPTCFGVSHLRFDR